MTRQIARGVPHSRCALKLVITLALAHYYFNFSKTMFLQRVHELGIVVEISCLSKIFIENNQQGKNVVIVQTNDCSHDVEDRPVLRKAVLII